MGIRILVPGHGLQERASPLEHSLSTLRRFYDTTCHVYTYASTTFDLRGCVTIRQKGLWTDFMRIYDPGSDDVLLMMDDMRPNDHFNLTTFSEMRRAYNVDALSAAIPHWHHRILQPVNIAEQTNAPRVRYVSYIDMLFVLFSNPAWRCWSRQINTSINHIGWGYDITFASTCKVRLGVADIFIARHPRGKRTYSSRDALIQQSAWLKVNGLTHNQAAMIIKNQTSIHFFNT